MAKTVYLDYAAATPLDRRVFKAMEPFFARQFYNPSSLYLAARENRQHLDNARQQVADLLGSRPTEIIFTSGGTEANNLAINGVMQSVKSSQLMVSAIEHESVLAPASQYDYSIVPVGQDGRLDLDKLVAKIQDTTVLISVIMANNEIGTVQPVSRISKMVQQAKEDRQKRGVKMPLYFHVDACQAANYMDLHVSRLGADLMTLNGGKIYGPKQSGVLYVKTGTLLKPQILGGGQEGGRRSGTENLATIVGFSTALLYAQQRYNEEADKMRVLQNYFIDGLRQKLPFVEVNGSLKYRVPNNINILINGYDNERLVMELDQAGIQCATGSACSSSSEEPSHVLRAIGRSVDQARSSIRLSFGRSTTKESVDYTMRVLEKLCQS